MAAGHEKTMKRPVPVQALMPTLATAVLLLLGGCIVAESLHTAPPTQLAVLKPGSTGAEAAKLLGEPMRTWRPNEQVVYRLYPYKRALKVSYTSLTGGVVMDVITLGGFELLMPLGEKEGDLHRRPSVARVWISFDSTDHLLGVFQEMDELPEDGKPVPPAPPPVAASRKTGDSDR